ncbi:siderophore-interacting protein [Tropicibacter sp. R16_0]|uniref:siderophore-interacting protein n=1 Tax=Tropicibacter sp. R16_0 TaxID=2821102 RepID=UPI001ADC2E47|nr:siderophore-interacting protein [Tropicibacter sp. R16_0]MBO9448828.1 siderophore-interacting protein [Tropicibacter sp. R16_0]
MAQAEGRNLKVHEAWNLTPNMRRIVLGGDELQGFPAGSESGYIKLIFPNAPRPRPDRPAMRTFTVRAFDAVQNRLTVDFALHDDTEGTASGPAAVWARDAKPGDDILIAGPGKIKWIDTTSDWLLLAGDMTALPALLCNLEALPADAKGEVVMELTSPEDAPEITLPDGMTLHLIINPHPDGTSTAFVDHIRSLTWRDGTVSVWAACEFKSMQQLRSYFRNERGVDRTKIYLSSYWKAGVAEDEHKKIKGEDAARQQELEAAG